MQIHRQGTIILGVLLCSYQIIYVTRSTHAIYGFNSILDSGLTATPSSSSSSALSATTKIATAVVPRFHEVLPDIIENAKRKKNLFETAYNQAHVVSNQTSWFTPKKLCQEKCCAETVAISLQPDSQKIINTMDGFELADVAIQQYRLPEHAKHQASILHEDMLPCLQPGTVFQLENHGSILDYFFQKIRPNITVPYVIITSRSDADSPYTHAQELEKDNLLLKWYGTNPRPTLHSNVKPMPLGLSIHHNQERILKSYLEVTNFTNPFRHKDRWLSSSSTPSPNHVSPADIFVQFSVHNLATNRQVIWDILCGNNSNTSALRNNPNNINNKMDNVSCVSEAFETMDVYAAASQYLFAVSPPGAGYDCYRTYEWLLLGVIPIVMERPPSSQKLFEDLPVVFMPREDMYDNDPVRGYQKYSKAIQNYTQSEAFLNSTFEDGWNRLFLQYWRRQILHDAGRRDQHILQDDHGNAYYQAWRYTPTHDTEILCHKEEHCNIRGRHR
mmetsp:Transcript_30461/g.46738  ORF Transcript_30461/g.46738 Transcript_30461/m.46738 type:complete len:501 (-) Transcript_30461:577-2079(-)